jgi:pimeloyl-ACP methyl ester carboxylesterase
VQDIVLKMLSELVPGGVRRAELRRADRMLRWVEAGAGGPAVVFDAGLGEPGSLAWAGVLPALAARTRVIAYDRAGVGASDPVSPLTVDGEIADVAALIGETGQDQCVLVGHSWGGLLAQLVAFRHPGLVAGLVLVDPAHEEIFAETPWPLRLAMSAPGNAALLLHSLGLAGRTIRGSFRPFAQRVSDDPRLQALILDAYTSSYAKRSQVRVLSGEHKMITKAIPLVRQIRAASDLPDVPVVVMSATKGLPKGMRGRWTALQADLVAKATWGEHIVAEDTGHAIHQERPEQVTDAVTRVIERIPQ